MSSSKRDEHPTLSEKQPKKLKPNHDNITIQQGSSSIHQNSHPQEIIIPYWNEMIKNPPPENPQTIKLNKNEYIDWNVEQVASILIAARSVGGCNLSVDDVLPFVEAKFKGSSLHNIVQDLNRKKENQDKEDIEDYALTKLERIYNKNDTPQLSDTCKSIENWVRENLFKPNNPYRLISQPTIVRSPLKGEALSKFLEDQPVEEVKPISESEGLFFKSTASRDHQLEDFAKGILSRYSTFLLGLNRAKDSPLFEIRGPVGSGKTHFLLNATKEIAKKLSDDNWLEDEFNQIWDNNYILEKDMKPPTNWRKNLIESIENDIKIFATQRNGLSWNIEFANLTAFEYIAAMLATHHLGSKGRLKLANFKQTPLDLDNVLDLIREKFWQEGKLLLIEFCIDEIQLLIEGNERKTSKAYELIRALHSTSSRRKDLLLIPVIGGTTFPSNDEDAQSNINFVSLSGVANYVITLNPLMISKTIDLIKADYFDEYQKLMTIGIQELANLLLLIGPFPRCVEMLVRGLKNNTNGVISASDLYKIVKNKLLLKYSANKESMIVNNARETVEILRHILEGRTGLKDIIAQKALMRGLISYQKFSTLSIIFVYLHIAICDNSVLKAEFDNTFLDSYFDALLKGATHARLMEDLVASFITLKARIYHYLGQNRVNADTFFAGATLGKKVKEIVLQIDKNMNHRSAKYCTDNKLSNVKDIELADGSKVDMMQNPTALVVGNQWTHGDGIITFNDKQAMIYETKKKSTPFLGIDVDDSFEHEQIMFLEFVSNLPQPLLFLYCNSGVTTITENSLDIISDYSMIVDQSNWLSFFRIIPKLYVTDREKKSLMERANFSFFQNSNPIITRPTEQSDIKQEIEEVDLLCYEDV